MHEPETVTVQDINDNQTDRTLILGYTVHRNTFHVYLKDGILHRHVYDYTGQTLTHDFGDTLLASSLAPNKRSYPQWCDFEFCKLLLVKGVNPNFTRYTEPDEESVQYHNECAPFAGKVI